MFTDYPNPHVGEEMVLYHGTVKEYLPSIMKEGLIPQKNVWQALWKKNSKPVSSYEQKGAVYLARNIYLAENFAKARAQYLRTTPGMCFLPPGLDEDLTLFKQRNAPFIHTSPLILKVTLSNSAQLERDGYSGDGEENGYFYRGIIPPKQLQVVHL